MTLAVDLSNYSGEISAAQAQALSDAGVRRAIVQTVNPTVLTHRQQIPALLSMGIEVEAYVYIWAAGDVVDRIRWANSELLAFPDVKRLWLDCEDVTPGIIPEHHQQAVQTARAEALLPVGIYTGAWWWNAHMGGWEGCADLPLWVAQYDGQQDANLAAPFGGWTACAMKQYQGDASLSGVPALDLDWYEEVEVETTPVVNADFTAFLSKLGIGGVTVGKIVGKPGQYLVVIPGEA